MPVSICTILCPGQLQQRGGAGLELPKGLCYGLTVSGPPIHVLCTLIPDFQPPEL